MPAEIEDHAGPTALPATDVPAPRAVSGTPSARQTSSTAATSSTARGKTTVVGGTRYSDASDEYIARVVPSARTSRTPARRSASEIGVQSGIGAA